MLDLQDGGCLQGRVWSYGRLRAFKRVCGIGRWADCLDQDLLDFGWIFGMAEACRCWGVDRGVGREFMRVYERFANVDVFGCVQTIHFG